MYQTLFLISIAKYSIYKYKSEIILGYPVQSIHVYLRDLVSKSWNRETLPPPPDSPYNILQVFVGTGDGRSTVIMGRWGFHTVGFYRENCNGFRGAPFPLSILVGSILGEEIYLVGQIKKKTIFIKHVVENDKCTTEGMVVQKLMVDGRGRNKSMTI